MYFSDGGRLSNSLSLPHFRAPCRHAITFHVPTLSLSLLQVRVDHRNGTLHFGGQQLESEKVRTHLSALAGRLSKAVVMIDGPAAPGEEEARSAKRLAAIKHAMAHTQEEHKLMNARKVAGEGGSEGVWVGLGFGGTAGLFQ